MREVDNMAARRRREAQIEASVKHAESNRLAKQRAQWENKSDAKIVARRKAARVAALRQQQQAQLLARRHRLAGLLNAEMEGWLQRVQTADETPEQRKDALRQRALALYNEREADRVANVDECYAKQWRDSCDDARTLDSAALLKLICSDRQEALQRKARMLDAAREEEAQFVEGWRKRCDEVDARETAKDEMRRKMDREVQGVLDSQVASLADRKALARSMQQDADQAELDEWRRLKQQDDKEAAQRGRDARERGRAVREFNETRKGLMAAKTAQERREDLLLLQYALDREAAEEAQEAAKRQGEREATQRFQEYLRMQMIKEAEDNSQIDAIRQKLENRIWDQKEAEQKRQHDAREFLRAEVDQGRQEQIAQRARLTQVERDEDRVVMAGLQRRQQELDKLEADKVDAHRRMRQENKRCVVEQMSHTRRRRQLDDQEKFLETKQMIKAEREHNERLSMQAGVARPYRPIKQSQWYT